MEETDTARSGKQKHEKNQKISGGREIRQAWQDFPVTRRLREDKGKGKT